ncbi:hypothetical protein RhiirA4_518109 [Rhizophagus irregularis]|uniref:Uncharacterized protein n=1 Tax=Rhizophagus irregularis TaxID=588596 RepID=A0A2I1GGX5_9GLOM|nr:hypothetical protein RhiirA4_518109 [Rhizophagus irregularis]
MAAIHHNDESACNSANNANIMKRYRYLKNLQLTCPIGIYRYAQGNYLGTITYVWKIPEVINEFQDETEKVRYSLIKTVTSAVLRMLYFELTGDAATTSNAISHKVEERLRLILVLEDLSIIFDLRVNSGFNGTKFDPFWEELNLYFNEVFFLLKLN